MEETRKKKIIKAATAVGLSAVVLRVFGFGYLIGTTSFGSDDVYIDTDPGTNMVFGDSEGSGMTISMLDSEYSLTSTNSTSGETYFTLKATPVTEDGTDVSSAENSTIEWSVEWTDSSASWASGKTVTSYVTVDYDNTSYSASQTCKVYCGEAFGSQIKVRATLVCDTSVSATVTVDYLQKATITSVSVGDISCVFGGRTGVTMQANEYGEASGGVLSYELSYGETYTIADTVAPETAQTPLSAIDGENRILEVDYSFMNSYCNTFFAFGYIEDSAIIYDATFFDLTIYDLTNSISNTHKIYFSFPYLNNFQLNYIKESYATASSTTYELYADSTSLYEGSFATSHTSRYVNLTEAYVVDMFDNIGSETGDSSTGTYNYVGGVDLFNMDIVFTGSYEYANGTHATYSFSTTFYISDVINTAAIDGIELDPTGIVF